MPLIALLALALAARAEEAPSAQALLDEGWRRQAAGDLAGAGRSFAAAGEAGADPQVVALALGYLAAAQGDAETARARFLEAAQGPDQARRAQAEAEILAQAPPAEPEVPARLDPGRWLEEGWRARAAGDPEAAGLAFRTAAELGADPQRVALELGWVDLGEGDVGAARARFLEAAGGPDAGLAAQARAEVEALPPRFWADLYGESPAWLRVLPEVEGDLVPFVRLRGFVTPWLGRDLHLYVALQGSRDLASRGGTHPVIYADNALILAPGVLARWWDTRAGAWAQVGPALMLVDDGGPRWRLDARAGAFLSVERPECRPARGEAGAGLCLETYDEVVYASRYDHDVLAMARGRAGFTPLVTGAVAWQPLVEARLFADTRGDSWNNQVDLGILHRWRVLGEAPVDLLFGLHAGRYLGWPHVRDVPDPPGFVELRFVTAGYWVF